MIKIGPQELRRDISEMTFSVFVTLPSLQTLHGSDTFEVKCRVQLRGTCRKAQDLARADITRALQGIDR